MEYRKIIYNGRCLRYISDVVIVKDSLSGSTLGSHKPILRSNRPPLLLMLFVRPWKTYDYSFIKIDEEKIKNRKKQDQNYRLENVIMHELGHAMGLAHFNKTDPLMDAHAGDCNGICPISDSVFEEFLTPYLSKFVDVRKWSIWLKEEKWKTALNGSVSSRIRRFVVHN